MWHMQLGPEADLTLPKRSQISQAGKFRVRKIVSESSGKYFVIVGVYNSADIDRLGEICSFIHPEDSAMRYVQSWSADTLLRAPKTTAANIERRREELEQMVLEDQVSIEAFAHRWADVRDNPVAVDFFRNLLNAQAISLLACQTTSRVEAGMRIDSAKGITDKNRRVNPGASAAKILKATSCLRSQLEFDARSLRSAHHRALLGEMLRVSIEETLAEVEYLLVYGSNDEVYKMLPELLGRLEVKPYWYGLRLIEKLRLADKIRSASARAQILEILQLEHFFLQYSHLISSVEADIVDLDFIDKADFYELEQILPHNSSFEAYEMLVKIITHKLQSAIRLGGIAIRPGGGLEDMLSIKETLRYRYGTNLFTWPVWPVILQSRYSR